MSSIAPHSRITGVLLVLISTFGFSAKSIFAKLAYSQGCDALTLVFWRMLLSLPFFLMALVWSHQHANRPTLHRNDWIQIGLLGVAGYYLSSILDFEGLMFIPASLERLTLFLYPTLVVLLNRAFYQQTLNRSAGYALMLSYIGIALVVIHDFHSVTQLHDSVLGTILVLGSSLSYACYLVGSQSLIRSLGSSRFTGYTLTVASITVLLHGFAQTGLVILHLSMHVFWLALATALFSTVMPVFFLTAGIARIGSAQAALISSAGPVVTLLLGVETLHENLSTMQIVGAAFVIAGVLLISKPARHSQNTELPKLDIT